MKTINFLNLVATLALVGGSHAFAATQSYPIDLNTPPKSVIRGHLDLGGTGPDGASVAVNSYYIEKNGKPFVPLIGEFHYSRYAAEDWEAALRKMKAGGLNIVATFQSAVNILRCGHIDPGILTACSQGVVLGRFLHNDVEAKYCC